MTLAPTEEAMEWTAASCDEMLGVAVVVPLGAGPSPKPASCPLGLNTLSWLAAIFGPT
jgi:hypothetical protein